MSVFVETHVLRAFPPSCLNRDDVGTPKDARFGGVQRMRISSQCLKRTWRMSPYFRDGFVQDDLGVRTDRLPTEVLKLMRDAGHEHEHELELTAKTGLLTLLASIGKKTAKASDAEPEEGAEEGSELPEGKTAHLLFLSHEEMELVAAFAWEQRELLPKLLKPNKKPDNGALSEMRAALLKHLDTKTRRNAVDVGMFGRFVTSDEFDIVDAGVDVAHALGVDAAVLEYDYFTAVDDLSDGAGAGHLGHSEFGSSVFYMYSVCDLGQLERNLGPRSPEGRTADKRSKLLARKALPALALAMSQATPKGKKTSTAPHTPADYVEVVVRRGLPLSLANAFLKPVRPMEADNDLMLASIGRLETYRATLAKRYERDKDVLGRFVLRVKGDEQPGDLDSIGALGQRLSALLETVEASTEPTPAPAPPAAPVPAPALKKKSK